MSAPRIGVTGATGLIGRNLYDHLLAHGHEVVAIDLRAEGEALATSLAGCDTVVNLAAVNRGSEEELEQTNVALARRLCDAVVAAGDIRVIQASTIRDQEDTPYGRGKLGARRVFEETPLPGLRVVVIPNVFGARGKPFHNTVVATFCHQLTHGETPEVIVDAELPLVYVNPLVERLAGLAVEAFEGSEIIEVPSTASMKVSEILAILETFKTAFFETRIVPELSTSFEADLWATFMSYVENQSCLWHPEVHADARGSLFELVRGGPAGQVFMSTSHPGILRGNHYHTRKLERFCVVKGEAVIRMRRIDHEAVTEFRVSGEEIGTVEIPIFHTHNIENVGGSELVTLFWANEVFDPGDPDTWALEVAAPPHPRNSQ